MGVEIAYFDGRAEGLGAFAEDFRKAVEEANAAGDRRGAKQVRNLLLDYLEVTLAAKTERQLERYLASRDIWKETEHWNVYRVPDTPSVCFAVKAGSDGSIRLVPVGVCYRYPDGGAEAWWRDSIEARVGSMT